MKKVAFLLLIVGAIVFSEPVEAIYGGSPKCYRYLQLSFFDPVIVQQALSLQDIPQNTWPLISRRLLERVKDVPYRIDRQARRMRPNPLKNPFNAEIAKKLLENALYEALSDVLIGYNIQNTYRIQQVFDYIKSQQDQNWRDCFGK